jgi:pimeloyl-ACP methyl ester carboxylesterase
MFITTPDRAQLYTASFGSTVAPALLAIGGWIGSWELWLEPFAILSDAWRCIAYDHRGAGATLAPVESITHENLVADVFAVLDAYGVDRCVLAAESAGALTALAAALRSPDRVAGLVLVDGLWYAPLRREADPFLVGLRANYQATLAGFVDACVPEPDSAHIKCWGRQILARASQESAIRLYTASGEVDLRPDLPRIAQPALILHGELDAIQPLAESRRLAQILPRAELVVFQGAGHVPTMTRAAEVASAINRFFFPPLSGAGGINPDASSAA